MKNLNTVFSSWKNRRTNIDIFYDEFANYCSKLTRKILNNYNLTKVATTDFEDLIPQIFMYVTKSYDPKRMPFDKYVAYILGKRLSNEIVQTYFADGKYLISLDQETEDGTPIIELIEDTNLIPIQEQVNFDLCKLELCSPKAEESIKDRRCRQIIDLTIQGYQRREIMKKLNIDLSQFRSYQNTIKKDKKYNAFKMDLK